MILKGNDPNLSKDYLSQWIIDNPNERYDLSGQIFENRDFSGWRMSKVLFNNSKFFNCNFSNADLSRANLSRSIFTNSNFENSWLYRCVFSNAKIVDCNFYLAKSQKVRWPSDFRLEN